MGIVSKHIARQLQHPSGLTGSLLGRLWNRRNAPLNDLTMRQLDLRHHDQVLEIGFGGGYLLEKILGQVTTGRVSGIDPAAVMVSGAARRLKRYLMDGRLRVNVAGSETIPFPNESFTRICTVNTIFYWSNLQTGLAEIYRVMAPGGRFAVTFTCLKNLEKKGFVKHGIRLYTEGEINNHLERAGFSGMKALTSRDKHREFVCITCTRPQSGDGKLSESHSLQ